MINRSSLQLEKSSASQYFLMSTLINKFSHLMGWENCSLVYTESGKPELDMTHTGSVSISHSQDMLVFLLSEESSCGIDLEYWKPRSFLQIAQHYFSKSEYLEFKLLQDEQLQKKFYLNWTLKESHSKYLGEGLGRNMLERRFCEEKGDFMLLSTFIFNASLSVSLGYNLRYPKLLQADFKDGDWELKPHLVHWKQFTVVES